MRTSNFFILKEDKLNNNCPECYSNTGLLLTFKQKQVENVVYKATTSETSHEMHCQNCNMQIFPARWTDEIEQVIAYKQRAIEPKRKSVTIKPLGWAFILFDLALLIAIILFATGVISF